MLKRGQVEVGMDVMEPTAKDAIIITNSVIDKLNDEIVRLGEAKMVAMQESKEYRKGSLHLRWNLAEKDFFDQITIDIIKPQN